MSELSALDFVKLASGESDEERREKRRKLIRTGALLGGAALLGAGAHKYYPQIKETAGAGIKKLREWGHRGAGWFAHKLDPNKVIQTAAAAAPAAAAAVPAAVQSAVAAATKPSAT